MAMEEDTLSPRNRLKFPCSYGGMIIPRPADGQLKYVGGDTRLHLVPRSITFADLHARVAPHDNPAVVIKYQLMPEDIDALVSVRNDEDVLHMIDQYDRHDSGASRFRLYLFSDASRRASPLLERSRPDAVARRMLAVSQGTSPLTAGSGSGMHRVRSSPNLGGSQQWLAAAAGSPRYHLRHPSLHKYTSAFGVGPWRAQAHLMSRGPHYEECGCGARKRSAFSKLSK